MSQPHLRIVIPGGSGQVRTLLARHLHGQGHTSAKHIGLPCLRVTPAKQFAVSFVYQFSGGG